MDTSTVNNTLPNAASAAALNINPTENVDDPFLSMLDAASNALDDEVISDDADAPSEDTDATERDESETDDNNDGTAVVVAPTTDPMLAGAAGTQQAQTVAKTTAPTDRVAKQTNAPGNAAGPDAGTAKQAANAAPDAKPAAASQTANIQAGTGTQKPADGAQPNTADFKATYEGVRAQPATANTAAAATTAQSDQTLPPDLRAERYAELRAAHGNPNAEPVRLAEIAAKTADPNTQNAANAQTGRTQNATASNPEVAARTAATPPADIPAPAPSNPTPAPSPIVVAPPFGPSFSITAPGQTATAGAAPDAPGAVGSLTGPNAGGPNDAARVAAATRGQPTATAKPTEQIAVQIKNGIKAGADKIHIRLQPATLGRVEVDLEVGPDQRVQAVVSVEKAETLEILERDARSLHRMLENAGFQTDNDSLAFRQQAQDGENPGPGNAPNMVADSEGSADVAEDSGTPERVSRHDGLLDVEV